MSSKKCDDFCAWIVFDEDNFEDVYMFESIHQLKGKPISDVEIGLKVTVKPKKIHKRPSDEIWEGAIRKVSGKSHLKFEFLTFFSSFNTWKNFNTYFCHQKISQLLNLEDFSFFILTT